MDISKQKIEKKVILIDFGIDTELVAKKLIEAGYEVSILPLSAITDAPSPVRESLLETFKPILNLKK